MGVEIIVPIAFFMTVVLIALGVPLVRAYVRRMDAAALQPRVPNSMDARLERIEAMVESVAVEVERLGEGQRFTTRLLSEGALRAPAPSGVAPESNAGSPKVTHA